MVVAWAIAGASASSGAYRLTGAAIVALGLWGAIVLPQAKWVHRLGRFWNRGPLEPSDPKISRFAKRFRYGAWMFCMVVIVVSGFNILICGCSGNR